MSFQAADEISSAHSEQAFGSYMRAVRRHWRLVAIFTVLAVVIASVTVERSSTTYSATASILVTPLPEGDAGFVGIGTVVETGDPARTVQTAAALIDTPEAAALAARQLGPPWTTASVLAAVSVTPLGASDVLAVTANAQSAAAAPQVANAFATSAVAYRATVVQGEIQASINQLEARLTQLGTAPASATEASALATSVAQLRAVQGAGREPTMSVSQTAAALGSANGTSRILILLLALVGGFAIGSVTALGLEAFSRPVRDHEEIESLYPIPVLAALPEVGRHRSRKGMPPWALPADVFEQLRMLRVQVSLSSREPVIMVTSAGAGDGKTTVAAALAAAFAEVGKRAILMDLDSRKPELLSLLGVAPDRPGRAGTMPVGVPVSVPALPGVRVFPVPTGGISNFETVVERLPRLLAQAKRIADVVIIDTAPVGEASETLLIAPLCNQVLFVARPRHTDRRRLVLARDLLERTGAPSVGMVLVGRETGMPRGDLSYAYSMTVDDSNGQPSEDPQGPTPVGTREAE